MNFIYCKTKELFSSKLLNNNIHFEDIVFIEDTSEIWTKQHFYSSFKDRLDLLELEITNLKGLANSVPTIGTIDGVTVLNIPSDIKVLKLESDFVDTSFEELHLPLNIIQVNNYPTGYKFGAYDSNNVKKGDILIDSSLTSDNEQPLYSFGLLSDIHNEIDSAHDSSSDTESSPDFINALAYFDSNDNIAFTCICGDVTQVYGNPSGWSYNTTQFEIELLKFQLNINTTSPRTPVYTTIGNHDCPQSGNINITTFKKYTNSNVHATDWNGNSFEISKTRSDGKIDHFLFLGMNRYNFTSAYLDSDITWLSLKLSEYSTSRCFVITHLFFPNRAGNFKHIYTSENWLTGNQLTTLQNLCDQYPNSIWFSGHSHWKWQLQSYEDKSNVWPTTNLDRTSGWCVHVPSCASPIDSDGVSTRVSKPKESLGAIVNVFENRIEIQGISFKGAEDSTYNTKFIPIARYKLYHTPAESPATLCTVTNIVKNYSKYPSGEDGSSYLINDITDEDGNIIIEFKFLHTSSGVLICPNETITNSNSVKLLYDDLKFFDNSNNEVNKSTLTKIGFYTDSDLYSLENGLIFHTELSNGGNSSSNYGILFQTSSSYTGPSPIKIQFTNLRYKIL